MTPITPSQIDHAAIVLAEVTSMTPEDAKKLIQGISDEHDDDVLICSLCHQTKSWHRKHRPAHSFNGTPGSLNDRPTTAPASRPSAPPEGSTRTVQAVADVPLRLAMIRRGLITPEDLAEVEKEMAEASVILHQQ